MRPLRVSAIVPEFGGAVIWMGGMAQLIGMPIAWLRLRKTDGWRSRPGEVRRIDLLAGFIREAVDLTIVWTFLAVLIILASSVVGWSGVAVGAAILLFAGPLLFVPWIVLSLDVERFPEIVEQVRLRRL
jgi:hypothetical protein